MSSFLRSIRTLCHLHRINYSSSRARLQSTSKSQARRHRRVGSGSPDTESPSQSRHGSISAVATNEASSSALAVMESLWDSLEQWFLLLAEEVNRVEAREGRHGMDVAQPEESRDKETQAVPGKNCYMSVCTVNTQMSGFNNFIAWLKSHFGDDVYFGRSCCHKNVKYNMVASGNHSVLDKDWACNIFFAKMCPQVGPQHLRGLSGYHSFKNTYECMSFLSLDW